MALVPHPARLLEQRRRFQAARDYRLAWEDYEQDLEEYEKKLAERAKQRTDRPEEGGKPSAAAQPADGDKQKALDAGCAGYITKPISPKTFISQFQEILRGNEPLPAENSCGDPSPCPGPSTWATRTRPATTTGS